MEIKNKVLIFFVVILGLLVVGLCGYIVYDKVFSDNINISDVDNNKEEQLSIEEINNLEIFINGVDNNALTLIDYSNPNEILIKDNANILKYSINASVFSKNANDSQKKVIWNGMEAQVSTRVSSIDDLSMFLKQKINYDFSNDEIKSFFSENYNDELGVYYYLISDSIFEEHKIVDGYKISNEYHISLDNKSKLVLRYDKDNIYFYSCDMVD